MPWIYYLCFILATVVGFIVISSLYVVTTTVAIIERFDVIKKISDSGIHMRESAFVR